MCASEGVRVGPIAQSSWREAKELDRTMCSSAANPQFLGFFDSRYSLFFLTSFDGKLKCLFEVNNARIRARYCCSAPKLSDPSWIELVAQCEGAMSLLAAFLELHIFAFGGMSELVASFPAEEQLSRFSCVSAIWLAR